MSEHQATKTFFKKFDVYVTSAPEDGSAVRQKNIADAPGLFSFRVVGPLIPFLVKCLTQLFRPHFFVLAIVLAFNLRGIYQRLAITVACYLGYSLSKDIQFSRGFLGTTSRVKAGVYYKKSARNVDIAARVPGFGPKPFEGTWWLPSGDLMTLFPFFVYRFPAMDVTRRWLDTADGEQIAVDFAFPPTGFDPEKPIILILHGLNGGSHEEYVKAVSAKFMEQGCTIAVMIARGLMQTPVKENFFCGSRIDDVALCARTLRKAFGSTRLYGVGISMGAMVLSNYVGASADKCDLDAAVCVSGCIDTFKNMTNPHSLTYWQPALVHGLKENFLFPAWNTVKAHKKVLLDQAVEAKTIVEFDAAYVAPYNGFAHNHDYYRAMSTNHPPKKLLQVSVPLLSLNADDDPMIDVDTFPVETAEENDNLIYCISRGGGHVGWCEGSVPTTDRWGYMTGVVRDFLLAHHSVVPPKQR